MPGASSFGDVPQDVHRRRQGNAVLDLQRRLLSVVGGMEDEAAAGFHGAAEMNADQLVPLDDFGAELFEKVGKGDRFKEPIENEPHGAVGGVRHHVDDGPDEPGVPHLRHGDEQVPAKVGR